MARGAGSSARSEHALRQAGFATVNVDYPSHGAAIEMLAGFVAHGADAFLAAPEGRVHIVRHCTARLIARALITRHRPLVLGRVVMLGRTKLLRRIA